MEPCLPHPFLWPAFLLIPCEVATSFCPTFLATREATGIGPSETASQASPCSLRVRLSRILPRRQWPHRATGLGPRWRLSNFKPKMWSGPRDDKVIRYRLPHEGPGPLSDEEGGEPDRQSNDSECRASNSTKMEPEDPVAFPVRQTPRQQCSERSGVVRTVPYRTSTRIRTPHTWKHHTG